MREKEREMAAASQSDTEEAGSRTYRRKKGKKPQGKM